jgi:hypothetical protein
MEYKKNTFKVSVDDNLSFEEISQVHCIWREVKYSDEWKDKSWNYFKNHLGIQFIKQQDPNWIIESKNKWLWAKIKYGL